MYLKSNQISLVLTLAILAACSETQNVDKTGSSGKSGSSSAANDTKLSVQLGYGVAAGGASFGLSFDSNVADASLKGGAGQLANLKAGSVCPSSDLELSLESENGSGGVFTLYALVPRACAAENPTLEVKSAYLQFRDRSGVISVPAENLPNNRGSWDIVSEEVGGKKMLVVRKYASNVSASGVVIRRKTVPSNSKLGAEIRIDDAGLCRDFAFQTNIAVEDVAQPNGATPSTLKSYKLTGDLILAERAFGNAGEVQVRVNRTGSENVQAPESEVQNRVLYGANRTTPEKLQFDFITLSNEQPGLRSYDIVVSNSKSQKQCRLHANINIEDEEVEEASGPSVNPLAELFVPYAAPFGDGSGRLVERYQNLPYIVGVNFNSDCPARINKPGIPDWNRIVLVTDGANLQSEQRLVGDHVIGVECRVESAFCINRGLANQKEIGVRQIPANGSEAAYEIIATTDVELTDAGLLTLSQMEAAAGRCQAGAGAAQ